MQNTPSLGSKITDLDQKQYDRWVKQFSPPSTWLKNCLMAFLFGGGICAFGQLLFVLYEGVGLAEKEARMAVSITLIFIAALLTALKVFDNIAKVAGAGTIVPITGFANSIVSPAMEYKSEGFVMGLGAKMFIIAGPVLVYGITASVVYGMVLYIIRLFL
ncbi:MAG: stage V sporulation protein AC [Oscillospiraceae bacterium]|nr:stage V sporulation protein AC [Oscillospiraceae bacterium]